MAIIKCKMCGGDLVLTEGATTAECEYCGSLQTVPAVNDDKKTTLFNRANRLRFACEFDKAAGIYESIVADFPEEAEAYWGIVLCKYGIEYVDDPGTGKKTPTCHRSSFDSIMDDSDFEQACENADAVARRIYREEAKQIEELRKGIIEVSSKEKPYDIFICYKETDDNGNRTLDSVLAQDIYDALTAKGYRTFFSRISLEDKLGLEYEPYIFAALNSAKIMLAVGTDYEYYNAVWVKNEWSRFLKLIAKDNSKHLVPCYKGIDAYDMPKEFAKLQAQDMGKIGAMQDLLRGVDKLLAKAEARFSVAGIDSKSRAVALTARGSMALEDSDWVQADNFFEEALNFDPQHAPAYMGKLCVELKYTSEKTLAKQTSLPEDNPYFKKAVRFADSQYTATLEQYRYSVKDNVYMDAVARMQIAKTPDELDSLKAIFEKLNGHKDAVALSKKCADLKNELVKQELERAAKLHEERRRAKELFENAKTTAKRMRYRIAAGSGYTAGLRNDGSITASGRAHCCTEVYGLSDITKLCSGGWHTVGLRNNGTVVACGLTDEKQCNTTTWNDIVSISAGNDCTIGVNTDGTVVACGNYKSNGYDVSKWKDIAEISIGGHHIVGLHTDGTLVACGNTEYNQCYVYAWSDIIMIEAGHSHTVALKANGRVVACGHNNFNQCDVAGWSNIVMIAAGNFHTIGLRSDGTVVACGNNDHGQCDVSEWNNIIAITTSNSHTIGLCADGSVVACGDNTDGQCCVYEWDLFKHNNAAETPQHNRQLSLFAKNLIAAGDSHVIGLNIDGTVLTCGEKTGDISNWNDVISISAGLLHNVGLRANGTVVATGLNEAGQCNVSDWCDIISVSAGWSHTVGLCSNGRVIACGDNEHGQCNVSDWRNIVAISTSMDHTVGLREDGSVVATGNNEYGSCNVHGWKNITSISAGCSNTIGLRADGSIIACGQVEDEILRWKDIVSIASGILHTVGLCADGTVVATGFNSDGQCDVANWHNIIAVDVGRGHTVGLGADGTVIACGMNNSGQCDLTGWKLFDNVDVYTSKYQSDESERELLRPAAIKSMRERLENEYNSLSVEYTNLKGLFVGKRKKEIATRMATIDYHLNMMSAN